MTTTAPQLRPGIYQISVARSSQPQFLTNGEEYVTILPPSAQDEPEQEWRIVPGRDANIIIERPSNVFPTSYLTYEGAPTDAKEGDRVQLNPAGPPRPFTEWQYTLGPDESCSLRVADSDLGLRIAPPRIYPPFLELGNERELEWVFVWLREE